MSLIHQDLGNTFNFAQYLMQTNQDRPEKIAYIDDFGSLTFASLNERIAQFGTSLLKSGLKRE
jgi:benzoate-CoA ligase